MCLPAQSRTCAISSGVEMANRNQPELTFIRSTRTGNRRCLVEHTFDSGLPPRLKNECLVLVYRFEAIFVDTAHLNAQRHMQSLEDQ